MYESLRDQRVVIIGGRSGIGLATAELLSRAGAELILANRNVEALQEVTKDLPGETRTYRVDVAVEEDVKGLFEKSRKGGGFSH